MAEIEKHAWDMAEKADENIETVSFEEMKEEVEDDDTVVVDLRDVREIWRDGTIPSSKNVPRGMLEFWADPETEYYKEFFDPDKRTVLFCNKGGRSALSTDKLQEMGFDDVAHLDGGFSNWVESGGEVKEVEPE